MKTVQRAERLDLQPLQRLIELHPFLLDENEPQSAHDDVLSLANITGIRGSSPGAMGWGGAGLAGRGWVDTAELGEARRGGASRAGRRAGAGNKRSAARRLG